MRRIRVNTARIAGLPDCNAAEKSTRRLYAELALIIVGIPVVTVVSILALTGMFVLVAGSPGLGFLGAMALTVGVIISMALGLSAVMLLNSIAPRFSAIRRQINGQGKGIIS